MSNLKSSFNMKKKIEMAGVVPATFRLIKEVLTVGDAVTELIDNAIDAKATETKVVLNKEDEKFCCIDNGCGMTKEQLEIFAANFASTMNKDASSIGMFGVGCKYAIVKLADTKVGATATVTSWVSKDKVNRVIFRLNEGKEKMFLKPEIEGEFIDNNLKYDHGTIISIDGITDVKDDRKWKANVTNELIRRYPYIMSKSDIKIKINGELIEKDFDRMHLCELGENINKNGVYQIGNDFTFYVNDQKFTKITDKDDVRSIKFIGLYVNQEYATNHKEERNYKNAGLFTMKAGKYINTGGLESHGNNILRGGAGLMRVLVMVDGNEDILGVNSNKNQTIKFTYSILDLYRDENNNTVNEVLSAMFNRLSKVEHFQTDGMSKDYRKVTFDIANRLIAKCESLSSLKKEVSSTSKENDAKEELDVALSDSTTSTVTDTDVIKDASEIASEIKENDAVKMNDAIDIYRNKLTGSTEVAISSTCPITSVSVKEDITLLSTLMLKYGVQKKKVKNIINEYVLEKSK